MYISFLSPEFLALAAAAVILLAALDGQARQLAFFLLNLVFAGAVLLGRVRTASVLVFILLGYALVRLAEKKERAGLLVGLAVLVPLFVWLRRYDFLSLLLPASLLTRALWAVGMSFVFFKIIHVMVDARSGTLGRLDLVTFVNYCLNFTTFMMGPIQRYQDYRDQWDGTKPSIDPGFEAHLDALRRILVGIVKAYFLAPFFLAHGLLPDSDVVALGALALAVKAWAFWFYIYLNFSGYCDVAIGLGSLIGVRPPENFDRPFLARNISDFWLRQHRSLTLWLTDYVFNPLYAKALTTPWTARHKLLAAYLCLMATMMISGLWHGTTLGFFLFGLVHGLWFVVYRAWDTVLLKTLGRDGTRRFRANPLVYAAGIVLTFNATAFAFIFFRLDSAHIAEALKAVTR